jgi:transcriptional regulator with XRE-family HTH domain
MSIGERIKLARAAAGLSQRRLADRVGLSAQAISYYERGDRSPDTAILLRLGEALGVRVDFFLRQPQAVTRLAFRKRASLRVRLTRSVEARVRDWLERYTAIEEIVGAEIAPDWPPVRADSVAELDAERMERAAEELRQAWGLGTEPIPNLIALLEDKGFRMGALPEAPEKFDAVWIEADGAAGIVLAEGIPGDRQRFSIAHEIGHMLLRNGEEVPEAAADRFAGAFLAPRETVLRELGGKRKRLELRELYLLKHTYGYSMLGWVVRARQLGIVTEPYERSLHAAFRRRGWHKREPGDQLPPERPTRMERLVLRAYADGLITESRAGELMGKPLELHLHEQDEAHGHGTSPVRLGSG